jgi:hypothetical protein
MAIKKYEPQESGLGKLLSIGKTVAGIATGNPLLIAGGVGGLAAKDSPVGRALGMVSTISDIKSGIEGIKNIGSAVSRRFGSSLGERGLMGQANLGVNTDLGVSAKGLSPVALASSAKTIAAPSLGGNFSLDTLQRRLGRY